MAYLVNVEERCPRCGKRCTVELRSRFNGVIGRFCKVHGKSGLKELQRIEDEELARGT